MLTPAQLACPPVVRVPEPMVAVATGQTAKLACLVNENASNQRLYWLDYKGQLIVNNSATDSYITHDGSSHGGQKYTISTGPLSVASYSYEKRNDISFRQGNARYIDEAQVLASSSSSIVISAALPYKNEGYGQSEDGTRVQENMLRKYAFKEEGGFRADENPDTRDPFLVSL